VTIPAGRDVRFRYLDNDGHWPDDPDADEVDENGRLLVGEQPGAVEDREASPLSARPGICSTVRSSDGFRRTEHRGQWLDIPDAALLATVEPSWCRDEWHRTTHAKGTRPSAGTIC
jgi:hypothetical protein